jgi:iron complex outermembrane receptor protein
VSQEKRTKSRVVDLASVLRVGCGVSALAIGSVIAIASPAQAQDATNQAPPGQVSQPNEATPGPNPGTSTPEAPKQNQNVPKAAPQQEIVITGTLLRGTSTETPSPVTILSSQALAQRGITTASDAVQHLSANNAGTISSGWNSAFNFASGATAPSLRGLTVQDTLSIFDGLRMAPYPLADDGERNFVDLNTIPNGIIDRIEVLRDGASSTYGADAIAGVVNIITKKEIRGLHFDGSYGISQHGDAPEKRVDLTFGHGDLQEQGYNFYISGEYIDQSRLRPTDRGYPYDTYDLSQYCDAAGSCLPNNNWNGVSKSGAFLFSAIPGVAMVRPILDPTNLATSTARYTLLNPQIGCRDFKPVTIDPSQSALSPINTCEVNYHGLYNDLQPAIRRMGVSARTTINLDDHNQLYAMANWYQTRTLGEREPRSFQDKPTQPTTASQYPLLLPVYVCPTGVGTLNGLGTGCNASNGVLNPYDPYAAQGLEAQINMRNPFPRLFTTNSRALRGVVGINGSFLNGFNYTANVTASDVEVKQTARNNMIPQRLMNAVARGEINFNDPYQTPQSVWDYVMPTSRTTSDSKLLQVDGTISRSLFALPGGNLQLALGATYRKESIDQPSANPAVADPLSDNPYDRYTGINAVGTSGSRSVKSGYFEINAPFADLTNNGFGAELNVSGRYDKYSTGQHAFSPKIGAKFTPIKQLAIRGTWSKGFRIPSFNESFGLPTTGFVGRGGASFCTQFAAYCASHGNNGYVTQVWTVGLTTTGNPSLQPEKSTSKTLGLVFQPIRPLSLTVDYYDIKINNLIIPSTPAQQAQAFTDYFTNNGVVNIPGVVVTPDVPDPEHPNALPRLGFIATSFQNASSQNVRGIDFGANLRLNIAPGLKWTSYADASYLIRNILISPDGTVSHYEGSLSPCGVGSCSGSPRWRASWQNTLDFGNTTVSLTAYYTKGMFTGAIDQGATPGDCASGITYGQTVAYEDGTPFACYTKDVWNADLTVSHKFGDKLTVYANVLDVFNFKAPFDPAAAYGLFNYNPAWAGPNIMGRFFRIGARIDLNPAPYVAPVVEAPLPPPPPPAAPATQTCPDGSVILATAACPAPPPPPPPPPAPAPERG